MGHWRNRLQLLKTICRFEQNSTNNKSFASLATPIFSKNLSQVSESEVKSRRFKRINFNIDARLYSTKMMWETELIDISLKGALIHKPVDWDGAIGKSHRLEIRLHMSSIISVGATAMNATEDTIGLRIDRMDFLSFMHLRRLLELNLAEPDALQQEFANLV